MRDLFTQLKKDNWQPNQTNRFNFYHFLRKIKRELNISKSTELTPHTLRRSFATYHAEKGIPLPLLQKLLGHASIRTTALYWRNIHHDPTTDNNDNDIADILTGKNWLERPEPSNNQEKPPALKISASPITENLPEHSEPAIIPKIQNIPNRKEPTIPTSKSTIKDNSPATTKTEPNPAIISEIQGNIITKRHQTNEQLNEQILLKKISELAWKLEKFQAENDNLKILVQQEKQRADQADTKLKTVAKTLYQLQKENYYKQLEQERAETEAKIIQPLPFKSRK